MKIRLTRDFVVPAGTEFHMGLDRMDFPPGYGHTAIWFDGEHCARFVVDVDSAKADDRFEVVEG